MVIVENKPLVSIGMPVYNGGKYLRQALDSLLTQEYRHFELIISDNDSSDDTQLVCSDYAKRDDRVKYHRNDKNIGMIANFRQVLELATGKYFMWAACDDLWLPKFISATVQELEENPAACVSMSAVRRIYEDRTLRDVVRFDGGNDPNHMSRFRLAMLVAVGKPYHLYMYGLYRAHFLKTAIQYLPLVAGGDRLFICQLALNSPFRYVDEVLQIRQVSNVSLGERYKDEGFGRVWQNFFAKEWMVLVAGPLLFNSPLIPLRRKFLIPLLVFQMALRVAAFRLRWFVNGVRHHWRNFHRATRI